MDYNVKTMEDTTLQPMTLKDWLITMLLMLIPVVNIVLIFVWAFGSNVNKSKKTFFQAQLIFMAIIIAFYIVVGATIFGAIASNM